jgi:Phage tail lysozyme
VADDRRTQLFQTLTSLGVAPSVALGAMASLAGESSVNFDPSSLGDATIPGGSVGIGQWNRDRRTALLNYAQSQKASPNDFETQLGYLKQELSNPNLPTYQPGVLNALRDANSTAQGAQIWTRQFERPKVDNSAQRLQLASQVGSVDDQGNFTPGGGRAPGRPVTATPAAPGPIDPSIIARGGYSPAIPGTNLNSPPAVASTPGVLPGFPGKAQSDAFTQGATGLDKAIFGDQSGEESAGPRAAFNFPQARNVSPLLPMSSQIYGNTLTSMAAPPQWSAAAPGQSPYANIGGQAIGQQFGTQLGSIEQMRQMMAMMGNPYGDAGYG